MNWIYLDELKKYYNYSLEKNKFKGSFEEYIDYFLKSMKDIGFPHIIINKPMK